MKPTTYRRIRRHPASRETVSLKKDNQREQQFFGEPVHEPFFKPFAASHAEGNVQRKCAECEKEEKQPQQKPNMKETKAQQLPEKKEEEKIMKKADEKEKDKSGIPTFSERSVVEQNTRHFADCNGVSVEGHADANYANSYTSPGTSTPASDCTDCAGEECVVNTGTVVSVFTANPQITLPSVPSGLNECEQNAVQQFINTTLRAHELQHVAAFNTYRGTVRTPYTYRGCASGLDAYTQQIHDNIESARKSGSDARSSALDANGANIFNVPCNCPDPEPENGKTND